MSLIVKTIESRILGKEMRLSVYCPPAYEKKALPVLYFLHGRNGNENLLQWIGIDESADT